MSLSSETHDQRLDRFIRPLNWALVVAIFAPIALYTLWSDPNVTTVTDDVVAYAGLGALTVVAVLLSWGIRRIINAARERF